jgi:hypothetical protein
MDCGDARRRQGKGDGLANSARAASDQSYTFFKSHTLDPLDAFSKPSPGS